MYAPQFTATAQMFASLEAITGLLEKSGVAAIYTAPQNNESLQRAHAAMGGSGAFRTSPPCPHWVPVLMNALMDWLQNSPIHPIIRAALFHYELLQIRPFDAGNESLAARLHQKMLADYHPALGKLNIPAVQQNHDATAFVEYTLHTMQAQLESSLTCTSGTAEQCIVEYLQQHPGRKRQDLLEAMPHFSARVLDRHLQNLRETGRIEYRGSRKTGAYYPCP